MSGLESQEVEISGAGRMITTTIETLQKAADGLISKRATSGKWAEAPNSVIDLAGEIIRKYHVDLLEARIGFLFRTEPSKSQGKRVYAKAEKVSEKHKLLLDLDFLIWIDEERWGELGDEQRSALIDHELCHCRYYASEEKAAIVGHDVEEFTDIVERYGAWHGELLYFARSLNRGDSYREPRLANDVAQQMSMLPPRGAVVAVDPGKIPVEGQD
jgi:hypothetical protein